MMDKRLLFELSEVSSTEIDKNSESKSLGICYYSKASAIDFKISFYDV